MVVVLRMAGVLTLLGMCPATHLFQAASGVPMLDEAQRLQGPEECHQWSGQNPGCHRSSLPTYKWELRGPGGCMLCLSQRSPAVSTWHGWHTAHPVLGSVPVTNQALCLHVSTRNATLFLVSSTNPLAGARMNAFLGFTFTALSHLHSNPWRKVQNKCLIGDCRAQGSTMTGLVLVTAPSKPVSLNPSRRVSSIR